MKLVALGAVARPHGVRGELHVRLFNAASSLLLECEAVWLRRAGSDANHERVIEHARRANGAVLLKLAECSSREEADALRGYEVCLPRERFPEAASDEYYQVDLMGLQVRNDAGDDLGRVIDVVEYPSVVCLRVEGAQGTREVPMTGDFVTSVDLATKQVIVQGYTELPVDEPRSSR